MLTMLALYVIIIHNILKYQIVFRGIMSIYLNMLTNIVYILLIQEYIF